MAETEKCPQCGNDNYNTTYREGPGGNYETYCCGKCGHVWTLIGKLYRQLTQAKARIKQLEEEKKKLRDLLEQCASAIKRASEDGDLRHGADGCSACTYTGQPSCFKEWCKLAFDAHAAAEAKP